MDKIGQIRRAYFEQHRSIKEIVRTLLVSRATVRKVIIGRLFLAITLSTYAGATNIGFTRGTSKDFVGLLLEHFHN